MEKSVQLLLESELDGFDPREKHSKREASIQKQPLPSGATGLIYGFPIHMFLNGEDQGIYTWNIPKKIWTFDMDSSDPNQIVFGCENQTGTCLFESESRSDSDWEVGLSLPGRIAERAR